MNWSIQFMNTPNKVLVYTQMHVSQADIDDVGAENCTGILISDANRIEQTSSYPELFAAAATAASKNDRSAWQQVENMAQEIADKANRTTRRIS